MTARFDPALIPPAPDLSFEQVLWAAGVLRVGGIDEAGRGPLAGPVAAAVVILPAHPNLLEQLAGVRDSKQMTPAQRQAACARIQAVAQAHAVGFAEAAEIDALGILPATRLAAWRAVQALAVTPPTPAAGLPVPAGNRYSSNISDQGRPALVEHCGCLGAGQDRPGRPFVGAGAAIPRLWLCPPQRLRHSRPPGGAAAPRPLPAAPPFISIGIISHRPAPRQPFVMAGCG